MICVGFVWVFSLECLEEPRYKTTVWLLWFVKGYIKNHCLEGFPRYWPTKPWHNGLKPYEMDAFRSWIKTFFHEPGSECTSKQTNERGKAHWQGKQCGARLAELCFPVPVPVCMHVHCERNAFPELPKNAVTDTL